MPIDQLMINERQLFNILDEVAKLRQVLEHVALNVALRTNFANIPNKQAETILRNTHSNCDICLALTSNNPA